jgi:hypothetical protein
VRTVIAQVACELLDRDEAAEVLAAALETEVSPQVRAILRDEIEQLSAAVVF